MTERDPFGRLPGENTLAGLGVGSDDHESIVKPEPAVAEVAASEEPAGVTPRPPAAAPRRRSAATARHARRESAAARRTLKAVAPVVAAMLVAIVGAAGLFAGSDAGSDRLPALPSPAKIGDDAPAPRGLSSRSLLARANLAPALRRLRTSGLGRLRSLRIAPVRIDAQLLTRGGRLRNVQLRFDGTLNDFGASGSGYAQLPTIAFSSVDARAPALLARGAARRLRRPLSHVDYVVLLGGGLSGTWTVVMRGGGQFIGDARGRITRRIN